MHAIWQEVSEIVAGNDETDFGMYGCSHFLFYTVQGRLTAAGKTAALPIFSDLILGRCAAIARAACYAVSSTRVVYWANLRFFADSGSFTLIEALVVFLLALC